MDPVKGTDNRTAKPADHPLSNAKHGRRWLRLLEHADVASYRLKLQPALHVEMISSVAARLTGYSREQLASDPQLIWRIVHPDDRQRVQPLVAEPAQASTPSSVRLVHREGRVLHVEHLALVTTDADGAPTHVQGILRDVTPLRTQQPVHEHHSVIDDGQTTVYLADPGGFAAVTSSIEALTGFTADEWISQPTLWAERMHPDDRARVLFLSTGGAAGQAWQAEYRWLARDGHIVWIRQASAPIRDDRGELVCLHGVLLESPPPQQARSVSIADQRMDALARLAGVVAHDFNNLLTVILGHTEMLLDNFPEAGLARDSAVEIKHAGDAATRIAKQLLALSGRQSLELQTIDLNEAIRDFADTLHELAGGDVELRFDLGSGLPRVQFDVKQLQRVLRNLVIDARDAMSSAGRITIATRAVDHGNRREVRLTAADSRPRAAQEPGVSPFEPFITGKKSPRGAGLNRAATYGIIRQVGGRISVDAAPGGGLIVTIGLPAKG